MSTVPLPAGEVALHEPELQETEPAAAEPKFTVPPAKLLPLTVTTVPPVLGPVAGLIALTTGVGGGAVYVNWSAWLVALVPPAVVTVT
jgi:hypothetical protein